MSTGTGLKWPRMDILETEKTSGWYRQIMDFAQNQFANCDTRQATMTSQYNAYNGKRREGITKAISHTYDGVANRNKYIDYRAGRTKIDILHGEYLKTPLNSTVRTINADAVVRKLQQYDLNLGAAHAKPHIEKLRSVGVDPMEGMDIPDTKDKDFKFKIKPKDRYEIIMQRIIDALAKSLDMVERFGSNFKDSEITARMSSVITVDEKTGSIDFEPFTPVDGLWFEFDKDPFMKRSFLMGRRRKLSINEILTKFDLTDAERGRLESIRNSFEEYANNPKYHGKYSIQNGEYVCDVIHIEWMGLKRKYSKNSPKTKNQMEFSAPDDGMLNIDITPGGYEKNKARMDKEAKKNGQEVVCEFTEELMEMTRIGHDLDIQAGYKKFAMKDEDTGKPLFSYTACVINLVEGEAISLQEIIDNFSLQFNAVMYQIFREVGKMKGKVLAFDKGMLSKGQNVKKTLYKLLNDSLMEYSSAGLTNMAGKDMQIKAMLQEFDLGLSESFPMLLNLKSDILQMLDLMTGINNERVGQIQASSTVSNAQSAMEASRTITEALFFYNHRYNEQVLMKLAETAKIVYGIYNPDKLREILGDEDFDYIMSTEGMADQKYGVSLINGREEAQKKEMLMKSIEAYANSKELRFPDLVSVIMSDSLTEIKNFALEGWNILNDIKQKEQQQQQQSQGKQQLQQQQGQMQMQDHLLGKKHELEMARDKQKIQGNLAAVTLKAKNDAVLESHKNELEMLSDDKQQITNPEQPPIKN